MASPESRAAHALASSERPWAVHVPSPGTVEYGLFDDGLWAPFSLDAVLAGQFVVRATHDWYDRDNLERSIITDLWNPFRLPYESFGPIRSPFFERTAPFQWLRSVMLLGVNPVPSSLIWLQVAGSGSLQAARLLIDVANRFDMGTPAAFRYADIDMSRPEASTHDTNAFWNPT